jgi:hypothetical protein
VPPGRRADDGETIDQGVLLGKMSGGCAPRRAGIGMRTKPGPPMSLANMRLNGVRAVIATCETCNRSADVNVDALPETTFVPRAGERLRCSGCRSKATSTRPAWHTGPQQGFRSRP